ncbi:uncharacterized protein [Halyomorpha halys]|uniref:uncharacterized protein isoform X2 n=1 Tax=Halyomorpha halys TaxID=286706 RepID=UPI0006D4D642|nr:uncharacterized protein LOC106681589 isoform X2 [Halyomorpha halys]
MTSYLIKLTFFIVISLKGTQLQKHTIPKDLVKCYENTLLYPMTMDIFIEIIRKIETHPYFLNDMRTFSSTLFHRFSRDGIEKDRDFVNSEENTIPYTTTGFQSFKFHLLSHYLLPQPLNNIPDDAITLEEWCTLHFMLSSSVDIWERGDENLVCPQSFKNQNTSLIHNRRKSACPIEKGVVRTKGFGTVSLNHVISGIAAALQPLQVLPYQMLDTNMNNNSYEENMHIDNKWVSTFAGDLAEMLIIQKPIIKKDYFFGPGGNWNDIRLPVHYYFNADNEVIERELWQFTDAEIMGAIDGMILAHEAMSWSQSRRILQLSQLLESYYTNRYTNHLHKSHASKRKLFFNQIMEKSFTIVEQVQSFSHILAANMPNYISNKSIINPESERLMGQFYNYASSLLIRQEQFHEEIHTKMKIRMNVIYDNTWSEYETLTFLLELAGRIDVSYHGSSITVIAGDIGNIIVKDCKSIGELYYNWKTYVHDRGTMLLPEILTKLNKMTIKEKSSEEDSKWFTDITVILAMSTSLDDQDINDSMILLKSIKQQNPDMIFVYITSTARAPMYVKLTSVADSQNDRIIAPPGSSCHQILQELDDLHFNPIAIKPFACLNETNSKRNIDKQDYVRPGAVNFYRIHPQYLCQVSKAIVIRILNKNYGTLAACLSRENKFNGNEQCQQISLNEEISFKIRYPCPSRILYSEHQSWNERCKPIYLRISAKQSLSLCTEKECRTPHDIRFQMIIEGLHCSSGKHMCSANGNVFSHL